MNILGKSVVVIVLLLWGVYACAEQKIIFSDTKHCRERRIVKALLEEEIKEARTLSKEPVQIDIALNDLNKDGINEILAYVRQYPYFCGAEGCWFLVFRRDGQTWKNILQLIVREEVSISPPITPGFVDLIVENKSVWSWKGEKYEFSRKLP